jgi:hypothetical protein
MPNFVGRNVRSLLSPSERDDIQWFMYCTHGYAGIPGGLTYVSTADAGLNGVVMAQSVSSGSTIDPNTFILLTLTVATFTAATAITMPDTVFIPPLI